jgi:UDP-glucose 4-epimerase
LADASDQHRELSIIALRYFNPIGAHPTGSLGEDPRGIPSNVLPYIMQVAVGRLPVFEVYGDDYDTSDGSGVRDYIHVMDVAEAHCIALERLNERNGIHAFNIGTGTGVSVLELLATFESVTGQEIPYKIVGRQQGDVATLIADPGRIQRDWGWSTSRDLQVMCRDAWRFQRLHPEGYISDSHNVQYSRAN